MKILIFSLSVIFWFPCVAKSVPTKKPVKKVLSHKEFKSLAKKKQIQYSKVLRKLEFKKEVLTQIKNIKKKKSSKTTSQYSFFIPTAQAEDLPSADARLRGLSGLDDEDPRWWNCDPNIHGPGKTQSCGPRYGERITGHPFCVSPAGGSFIVSPHVAEQRRPSTDGHPMSNLDVANILADRCESVAYGVYMQQALGANALVEDQEAYAIEAENAEDMCTGEYAHLLIECKEIQDFRVGISGGLSDGVGPILPASSER